MPQIYIEFSSNIKLVNFREILKHINTAVASITEVPPQRCKGRLIKYDNYLVGNEEDPQESFIYIQVGVQAKRSETQKQKIADSILNILKEFALPKLKEQKLKCAPRVEIRDFGLYLFSPWEA